MANNNKTLLIYTASGTTPVLATTGNYDLRVSPYSTTGIAGVHQGGGAWNFSGLDDTAEYKLYNTDTATVIDSLNAGGTTVFFDGDLQLYLKKAGGTMSGAIAMGTNKITGLGAGTANGDAVRWEQAGVITEARTITGVWTFDNAIPRVNSPTTTGYPTSNVHLTNKYYVDTLFAGAVGVVQSTNLIKCLPTRSTEDNYSKTTVEKCNAYLSGLSNIATYRGTMLIEALGQTGNAINLDDGSSDWISAGVDIVGLNRPVLTRRGYNSSLTVDGSLSGVKIVDDTVVSSRAYVNFTFKDCWFYVNSTEIAFTTCKFYNCVFQFSVGDTVTFSNCTGSGLTYNDDASVTFTGTQPANIISTNTANIGF